MENRNQKIRLKILNTVLNDYVKSQTKIHKNVSTIKKRQVN